MIFMFMACFLFFIFLSVYFTSKVSGKVWGLKADLFDYAALLSGLGFQLWSLWSRLWDLLSFDGRVLTHWARRRSIWRLKCLMPADWWHESEAFLAPWSRNWHRSWTTSSISFLWDLQWQLTRCFLPKFLRVEKIYGRFREPPLNGSPYFP
jgi:hypothetical protein